jgi:hypothetical protein
MFAKRKPSRPVIRHTSWLSLVGGRSGLDNGQNRIGNARVDLPVRERTPGGRCELRIRGNTVQAQCTDCRQSVRSSRWRTQKRLWGVIRPDQCNRFTWPGLIADFTPYLVVWEFRNSYRRDYWKSRSKTDFDEVRCPRIRGLPQDCLRHSPVVLLHQIHRDVGFTILGRGHDSDRGTPLR